MKKVNFVIMDHMSSLWAPNMEVQETKKTELLKVKVEPVAMAAEMGSTIKDKIGFIGSGNMCKALAGGLINKKTSKPTQIFCSDTSEMQLKLMKDTYGVNTFE
jgi:hypothetical protein